MGLLDMHLKKSGLLRFRRFRAVVAPALLAACGLAHAKPVDEQALQHEVNNLVDAGNEQPQVALAQLKSLKVRHGAEPDMHRIIETGIGLVAADNKLDDEVQAAIAELETLVPSAGSLAHADAMLVRTDSGFMAGESQKSIANALADIAAYAPFCDSAIAHDMRRCNAFNWFYANFWAGVLVSMQESRGSSAMYLSSAREIAQRTGRPDMEARALSLMAELAQSEGNGALSQRLLQRASVLAAQSQQASAEEFVDLFTSQVLTERGDLAGALEPLRQAQAVATRAGHRQRLNDLAINMIELELKLHWAKQALSDIEHTRPLIAAGDGGWIRTLAADRILALLQLRRMEEARRLLPDLLDSLDGNLGLVERSDYVDSIGEALADAGDTEGATRLFERERPSIRAGSNRHFEQRMLDRQAQLQAAQLSQRRAEIRGWSLAGAVALILLLAAGGAIPWLRHRNRRLARANDALRNQAERDPLTGLLNRDGLMRGLGERGCIDVFTGTLLLVDIDHFKSINDTLGHAGGDAALQQVCARLQSCLRDGDFVVRWGGEELVVAVLKAPFDADALVDRIMQSLAAAPVAFQQRSISVSASIGYACFPLDGAVKPLSLDEALAVADAGMYYAKRNGRRAAVRITRLPHELLADLGGLAAAVERETSRGGVDLRVRRLAATKDHATADTDAAPASSLPQPS